MRNLKRALSLALASVMLLGMMVVGSSAKGIDDFTDKAEIVNQDAVAVTSAIGMFEGYEDGSFGPENVVTRAEMAVIISTMLYGAGVNVNQFAETNVFTDVPAWAEGYVNLCSSLGIVAGVGEGKFDPNATVTTAQAVLMLCRALGYFQNAADFGDNWMLAATAKGTALGLYGDLKLTANEGLTRDNVAELVFNALTKAVPVQYNELLGVYYNENKGIIYSLTFYYTDTLGYKNFDLVYKTNENTDYGRPGTTWGIGSYRMDGNPSGEGNKEGVLNEDGSLIPERVKMTSDDEIITVADTPDFTYTANTKENVIYKAVGKSVVDDYTWTVFVDGEEQTDALAPANDKDNDYTYTAKGATTEIYVDDVNETVTVVMINYYLGEITKIKTDDDGEYATVRVLGKNQWTDPVDERDIYCTGFAEDEYVVITVDEDEDDDSFIASIADPKAVEGTVTYVAKASEPEDEAKGNYVKLDDGNKYNYSKYTEADVEDINTLHPTLDIAYRLYLDPNGYVLGFQALDDYYANYLYIEDADSYLGTIEAKVVLTDGTAKKVTIDKEWVNGTKISDTIGLDHVGNGYNEEDKGLVGSVYAYSEDDGVYTLRPIQDMDTSRPNDTLYKNYKDVADDVTGEINNGTAYITANGKKYIVDEDTVFVDVDENVIYTGFENVPDYKNGEETVKFWAIDTRYDDQVLEVVFIYDGEASNSNDDFFYAATTDYETYDKNKNYKTHDVYVNGEEKAPLLFTQTGHSNVTQKGLYLIERTNGEGIVTNAQFISENGQTTVGSKTYEFLAPVTVGTRSFSLTAADGQKELQYITDSDTVIVLVTYDLKSNGVDEKAPVVNTNASLKDMDPDKDDSYTIKVCVANTSDDGTVADLIYIVKHEKPEYDNTITFTGDRFAVEKYSGAFMVEADGRHVLVNDNQTVKFKINASTGYEVASVKLEDGTVLTAEDGVYTIKVGTKDLKVTVETTKIVNAQGTVSVDSSNNITVYYEGTKPTVPEAIKAIEKYLADAKYTDVTYKKTAANTYTFTANDEYGIETAFTWNAATGLVTALSVKVNGEPVKVPSTAKVEDAFAAAGKTIEGNVLNGTTLVADPATASVAAGAKYTDGNIKLTVSTTDYYGQAGDTVPAAAVTAMSLTGNWVKIGDKYVEKTALTFGDLTAAGSYTATAPVTAYWKVVVDEKVNYLTNSTTVDFSSRKSAFAMTSDGKIVDVTGTVNATKDETYVTGYMNVVMTDSGFTNIPGATYKLTTADGKELAESADGRMFVLKGEQLTVTVKLSGFTANTSSVEVEAKTTAGSTPVTVTAVPNGLDAAEFDDTTAGKIKFTDGVIISKGTTIDFTTAEVNDNITVTLKDAHTT